VSSKIKTPSPVSISLTKTPDIFDLYTDYLITSFSYTTATGLSGLVDNAISHDPVTRLLSQQDFTSKELGKVIKKTVREIETGECFHSLLF
jgi:hypothetical protein